MSEGLFQPSDHEVRTEIDELLERLTPEQRWNHLLMLRLAVREAERYRMVETPIEENPYLTGEKSWDE